MKKQNSLILIFFSMILLFSINTNALNYNFQTNTQIYNASTTSTEANNISMGYSDNNLFIGNINGKIANVTLTGVFKNYINSSISGISSSVFTSMVNNGSFKMFESRFNNYNYFEYRDNTNTHGVIFGNGSNNYTFSGLNSVTNASVFKTESFILDKQGDTYKYWGFYRILDGVVPDYELGFTNITAGETDTYYLVDGTGNPSINKLQEAFLNISVNYNLSNVKIWGVDYTNSLLIIINNGLFYSTPMFSIHNRATSSGIILNPISLNYTQNDVNEKNLIINNTLYSLFISGGQLKLYSSSNINTTQNLAYYNGVYYDYTNTCFDSVLGFGFFNSVSGNLLCTNFSNGYCNSNLSICTGGCTYTNLFNVYGVNYKKAICLQSNCSNTCGVLGEVYSDTLTSYKICHINVSIDGCSHWSPSISCGAGELSHNGICEGVNTSINTITKLNFGVSPYTAVYIPNVIPPVFNNNLWNVSYDPNTQTITAITNTGLGGSGSFPLYVQIPYNNPSYYAGFDCDYQSTNNVIPIVQDSTVNNYPVETINNSRDFIINGLNVAKQKITMIINPNQNVSIFSVNIRDVNDKVIQKTFFVVNKTNGEIIVYQDTLGGTVLYTQTFTVGINIGKITIDNYQNFNQLTSNNLVSVYRYVDVNNEPLLFTVGVGVIPYKDNLATVSYKVTVENSTSNIFVNKFENEVITKSGTVFSQLIYGTVRDFINRYDLSSCVYYNDGTYKARVYLSERFAGQYFSYVDLIIVKKDVTTIQSLSGNGNGFSFSPLVKIFIAIGSSVLIGLFFLIAGFINDNDTTRKIFIFIGLFVVVLGLVAFTIAQWIPAWIVILAIILAGLGVGIFFVSKSNGSE